MASPAHRGAATPTRRLQRGLRFAILALLVAAPIAFGSVHEPAYVAVLAVVFVTGLLSWARGHWARAHGADVPRVPALRILLALQALVLLQLIPLPPALLAWLSPGSSKYWDFVTLGASGARPISASPADTLRGLAFLAAMSLFFGTVFREFRDERWRRRLALAVAGTGFLITLIALLQKASASGKIFGLWEPRWDWSVFGPYVNRNHFAGYLVMAIPLAMGFAAEAVQELRRNWSRRRIGWVALGDPQGQAALQRFGFAMTLVVGLLASESRGGFLGFAVSVASLLFVLRAGWQALIALGGAAAAAFAFVGVSRIVGGFETRGIQASRLDLWGDCLRMWTDFPLFGAGFNAFGTAHPRYQTKWPGVWFGEAHSEYVQVFVDLGLVGAGLVALLLLVLFRSAFRIARRSPLESGLFASLVGGAAHNLVEFNWQIPANALTYVALAALAVAAERGQPSRGLDPPRPDA